MKRCNRIHDDGSFARRLAALAKLDLVVIDVVIDDFAISPMSPAERNDLLELLDDRIGTRSTQITDVFGAGGSLKRPSGTRSTALQRLLPVACSGRTHAARHQAVVRLGGGCWPGCQRYEVARS